MKKFIQMYGIGIVLMLAGIIFLCNVWVAMKSPPGEDEQSRELYETETGSQKNTPDEAMKDVNLNYQDKYVICEDYAYQCVNTTYWLTLPTDGTRYYMYQKYNLAVYDRQTKELVKTVDVKAIMDKVLSEQDGDWSIYWSRMNDGFFSFVIKNVSGRKEKRFQIDPLTENVSQEKDSEDIGE